MLVVSLLKLLLNLLQEEIHHKKSDIRFLKKEFSSTLVSFQHETSFIDFAYVSLLFLRSNNIILASKSTTQIELSKLVKYNIIIFNFSKYELYDCEEKASYGRFKFQFTT